MDATDIVTEMKLEYGEGQVVDEICLKCGKKFECYSKGVFEGRNGLLQVYSDDCVFCESCLQEEYLSDPWG